MGPYSIATQRKRHQQLIKLSEDPNISQEFRQVYAQLADAIVFTKDDYEARVVEVYTAVKDKFS